MSLHSFLLYLIVMGDMKELKYYLRNRIYQVFHDMKHKYLSFDPMYFRELREYAITHSAIAYLFKSFIDPT